MTTQNVSLVIMKAEELAALTSKMQQLEWRAAGYDRMKVVCDQQKGRIADLENRVASADETCRQYWTIIQNERAEVRQLKHVLACTEDTTGEAAHLRIAAAALEERVVLQEQQLEAADKRIKELEAVLVLKGLPDGSLDNVLQLARAA
ncbi:hypothetical protein [Vogesella sp. XCS3]|uniref:hypothetical protein n=1 Tax=Vogesella sp. XCS3 TaxID=2877939 RepID=UPI001D0AE20E|nr:hypothetical protein [Vogesella sp. XCS3]UDM17883.1 hypothetical protein LCH97_04250 [Vogesella sp. XCS3]